MSTWDNAFSQKSILLLGAVWLAGAFATLVLIAVETSLGNPFWINFVIFYVMNPVVHFAMLFSSGRMFAIDATWQRYASMTVVLWAGVFALSNFGRMPWQVGPFVLIAFVLLIKYALGVKAVVAFLLMIMFIFLTYTNYLFVRWAWSIVSA